MNPTYFKFNNKSNQCNTKNQPDGFRKIFDRVAPNLNSFKTSELQFTRTGLSETRCPDFRLLERKYYPENDCPFYFPPTEQTNKQPSPGYMSNERTPFYKFNFPQEEKKEECKDEVVEENATFKLKFSQDVQLTQIQPVDTFLGEQQHTEAKRKLNVTDSVQHQDTQSQVSITSGRRKK